MNGGGLPHLPLGFVVKERKVCFGSWQGSGELDERMDGLALFLHMHGKVLVL